MQAVRATEGAGIGSLAGRRCIRRVDALFDIRVVEKLWMALEQRRSMEENITLTMLVSAISTASGPNLRTACHGKRAVQYVNVT